MGNKVKNCGANASTFLRLAYPFRNGVRVGIAGGAEWRSSDMNEYYVGIPVDRSRVDRPAYDPGDSIQPLAQTLLTVPVGEKWMIRWTQV